MHHRDPMRLRVMRVVEVHELPVDPDRAGIGSERTRDDLDQRRLAGTVLAEQRMDAALLDQQVDVVQGKLAAESLGQPSDFEQQRRTRPARFAFRQFGRCGVDQHFCSGLLGQDFGAERRAAFEVNRRARRRHQVAGDQTGACHQRAEGDLLAVDNIGDHLDRLLGDRFVAVCH